VVHDDLGQDAKQLYDTHLGAAGVYFHPSIVGGDGFQLRAQVSFRDLPTGSTHPNWKVLRDRYELTQLAQAHSAKLRVWRKDTLRAFIPWAPAAEIHWETNGSRDVGFAKCYEPAMVHFEHEAGSPQSIPLTSLITADDYTKTLSATITGAMGTNYVTDRYRPKTEMEFSAKNLWPWWKVKHLGINAVPAPNVGMDQYEDTFLNNDIYNDSWYVYAPPLILLLVARVEQKKGLMRGHTLSEFRSSPQYWKESYVCSQCHTFQILLELTAAGGSGVNEPCRVAACPGTLAANSTTKYTCDTCGYAQVYYDARGWEGASCPKRCAGTMNYVSSTPDAAGDLSSTYTCDTCGRNMTVTEAAAVTGSQAGTVCGQACAGAMRGDPATHSAHTIVGPMDSLNFPAIGEPLGGLWIMSDGGARSFWAHEVGHHKHMEHAGGTAGGSKATQHDSVNNSVDADLQAHPPGKAADGNWDRACIMSYTSVETGPDTAVFCGKCILKLRGWKVEGTGGAATANSGDKLTNPAPGVQGP
jgi:hypothetical protein